MKKILRLERVGDTLVRLQDIKFVANESGGGLSAFRVETRPILPFGFLLGAFFWNVLHKEKDKEMAMQKFDATLLKIANE